MRKATTVMPHCSTLSLSLFLTWICFASGNENCSFASASPNLTNVKWNAGLCYFTVIEATTEASTKVNQTHWTFDIYAARRICAAHNATLPIFDADQEHSFVHENYREQFDGLEIAKLALGLYKGKWDDEYQRWDDGGKITHFKYTSIVDSNHSSYAVLFMTGSRKFKLWQWYRKNETWERPIAVLCQQRRQSQTGKVRRVNLCEAPFAHVPEIPLYDRLIGRVNEDVCYFLVNGSSVNEKRGDKYVYNVDQARQLCQSYGATLPTVYNYEECWRLAFAVDGAKIVREQGTEAALGIIQDISTDGFDHRWETGKEISFEGSWSGKYAKAAYTKIISDVETYQCTWANVLENETESDSPLLTFCEHRLTEYKPSRPKRNEISNCAPEINRVGNKTVFRGACYFKLYGHWTKLGIETASEECAEHGGVLPTIESEEENTFLATTFRQMWDPAILGLKQMRRPGEYRWIDGSPLTYEPSKWEARDSYAYATVLLPETGAWRNVEQFERYRSESAMIICREVSTTIVTPTKSGSTEKPPTTSPYVSKATCPPENSSARLVSVREENGVCYFTIEGSTAQANQRLSDGKWVFNVTIARQICSAQNVTLPVFDNDEEHSYVHENYRQGLDDQAIVQQMALGLYRHTRNGTSHSTWDDGSKLAVFKDTTITDPIADSSYAVAVMNDDRGNRNWQWHSVSASWDTPVGVLCQRRDPRARRVNRPNMCDTPADYFPKVHRNYLNQQDPEVCNFMAVGSTSILHEKVGDKYFYDMDKARDMCQQYGATLADIRSSDACRSLAQQYREFGLIEHSTTGGTKYAWIGLGLNQAAHDDGFTYAWENGVSVDYEAMWPTKFTKAAYTVVKFLIYPPYCRWENVQPNSIAQDLPDGLTVCQHRLVESKSPVQPRTNKISICTLDSPREGVLAKAALKSVCYFKISSRPEQQLTLSVSVARDRCAEFGGVLPVIMDDEENDFLASAFNMEDAVMEEQMILGLRQMHRPEQYQWIDGSPLIYEPHVWESRDEYAFATVLMLETKRWKNVDHFGISDVTRIICRDLTEVAEKPSQTLLTTASTKTKGDTTVELRESTPTVRSPRIGTTSGSEAKFTTFIVLLSLGGLWCIELLR